MPLRRDALLLFYKRRREDRPTGALIDLRIVAYFGIMLALIGLAGWLFLHQSSEVAVYAHEIRELEWERERLHRRIVARNAEVARLGSLSRVLEKGDELGYRLPDAKDASRHIQVAYPGGDRLVLGAAQEPTASSVGMAERDRGLLQTLLSQFNAWLASTEEGLP